MLRFGISGCGGFIEKGVIPMLLKAEGVELIAAFDANANRTKEICAKFGIKNCCSSFEELLGCGDVDVVYVASPNFLHAPQTIAAAKAGKHVFCQKPTGINADECRVAIAACEENGVKYGVGFCNRFYGAVEKTKEMIKEGKLGEVSHIYMSFNLFGYTKETVGWRVDPKLAGGGPLMDVAPHLIDLARFLIDDEAESVMGYVSPEKTETDVEYDALAIIQMKNGGRAIIDTSFDRRVSIDYSVVGSKNAIRCRGGFGWLTGGKQQSYLTLEPRGQESKNIEYSAHEHLEKEINEFVRAIESKQDLPVSGVDGLKAQQIIDAIYESNRTGKRIKI